MARHATVALLLVASLFAQACAGRGAKETPPQLTDGKAIYEHYCQRCHGAGGWGDGPQAQWQFLPPANFHADASRSKSDEDLLRIIEHGFIFSPMHSWREDLNEQQRQEVLSYIRMLSQRSR
jgi:mono/diheme cytochrome c family protein